MAAAAGYHKHTSSCWTIIFSLWSPLSRVGQSSVTDSENSGWKSPLPAPRPPPHRFIPVAGVSIDDERRRRKRRCCCPQKMRAAAASPPPPKKHPKSDFLFSSRELDPRGGVDDVVRSLEADTCRVQEIELDQPILRLSHFDRMKKRRAIGDRGGPNSLSFWLLVQVLCRAVTWNLDNRGRRPAIDGGHSASARDRDHKPIQRSEALNFFLPLLQRSI